MPLETLYKIQRILDEVYSDTFYTAQQMRSEKDYDEGYKEGYNAGLEDGELGLK